MACDFYRFEGSFFGGDYFCIKKGENGERVNSDTYYRYCRDYSYDECPIYKYNKPSSGCFITTVTCDILKKDDNHHIMNTLRNFRDNVLQKDCKYYNALKEYDVIGPKIAEKVLNDEDKIKMANYLYLNYLIPVCGCVSLKKYDDAVLIYVKMMHKLIDFYGYREEYNRIVANNYDNYNPCTEKLGHGRVKTKIIN